MNVENIFYKWSQFWHEEYCVCGERRKKRRLHDNVDILCRTVVLVVYLYSIYVCILND